MSFKTATFNRATARRSLKAKALTAKATALAMLLVGSHGLPLEIPLFGSRAVAAEASAMIPANVSGDAASKPSQVQLGDDVIVLGSRVFDIPFQMDTSSAAKRILLYVSRDQGQTWQIAANEPINVSRFHFQATEDGEFWFTTETDLAAQANAASEKTDTDDTPTYVRTGPQPAIRTAAERVPQRKIYVDTVGPVIELNGSADLEGKVSLNLTLTDTQKVASLRVLYATDVVREWKTVSNASIDAKGDFRFQPKEDWRQVSVHITATDVIGNASVEAKTFRRPRVATKPGRRLSNNSTSDAIEQLEPLPGRYKVFEQTVATDVVVDQDQTLDSPLEDPAKDPRATESSANQLTVKVAAGPADPPNLIFGPQPGTQAIGNAVATNPAASQGITIGSGVTPAPNAKATSRANPTFGSAFDSFAQQTLAPQTSPSNSTPAQATPKTLASQPQQFSLPASGLSAKTSPTGIEVVPVPAGEPVAGATPSAPETRPKDISLAPTTPPAPTNTTPSGSALESDKPPTGPRSLQDAMRPLDRNPPVASPSAVAETIPTPAPSQSPGDRKRYQAEKAEQENLKQQQLFDRAQLASRVPIRHSDSNRFSLEYEVEAIGNAGARAIELYGSLDAGQTWKRWGADPDRQSPFDIETKGEGLFSFRIVVQGNNGLASPRPLEGDTPDIAVLVDQTKPTLRLTSARYGEGDRIGSLVIRYECEDEHLMNRGIRVSFSDSLEGPWTTVAAGLRNDGLYVWPADPKLPRMIYLRLDATDQAGNVGTYILDQPIETQGLAPRAKILGFRTR